MAYEKKLVRTLITTNSIPSQKLSGLFIPKYSFIKKNIVHKLKVRENFLTITIDLFYIVILQPLKKSHFIFPPEFNEMYENSA